MPNLTILIIIGRQSTAAHEAMTLTDITLSQHVDGTYEVINARRMRRGAIIQPQDLAAWLQDQADFAGVPHA